MRFRLISPTPLIPCLLTIMVCGFISACAKQRPIEKLKDPEREYLQKSDFSKGMWSQKVTIVKASGVGTESFGIIGTQSENQLGYFEFTKNELRFYDALSLKNKRGSALPELINAWPITHHDVRLAESDGYISSRETEDDEKPFDQKRFVRVDFSSAKIAENGTFPDVYWNEFASCWSKKGSSLVPGSMKAEPDHITWTISVDYEFQCYEAQREAKNHFAYTVHYKYSFRKLESSKGQKIKRSNGSTRSKNDKGFFQYLSRQY